METNDKTDSAEEYENVFNVSLQPYDFGRHGRRTKCTPEIIRKIAIMIANGSTAKEAALLAGISESVFYRWIKRGRKERIRLEELGIEDDDKSEADMNELPYLELFEAVNTAIPLRKAILVERIRKAGEDSRNWTANAWLLERLHPDEFGRKTRLEITKVPWQEEVVEVIRQGVSFELVAEKIGDGQARELFERAGVEVPRGRASSESNN